MWCFVLAKIGNYTSISLFVVILLYVYNTDWSCIENRRILCQNCKLKSGGHASLRTVGNHCNQYNVYILYMHLPLLDGFPDSTLILVHLLVLVLLESGTSNQVCKNISNKNSYSL